MTEYRKNYSNAMTFSDTAFKLKLAASTALSITIPGNSTQKYRACFRSSFTAEIWVCLNGTAVLPTGGTQSSSYNQEFIPLLEPKSVMGGDTLSFISTGTPEIGVSLLQIEDIT